MVIWGSLGERRKVEIYIETKAGGVVETNYQNYAATIEGVKLSNFTKLAGGDKHSPRIKWKETCSCEQEYARET